MLDLRQIQQSFSHDPSRRGDRSPFGAAPAGVIVRLILRVDECVRDEVSEAWVEVLDHDESEGADNAEFIKRFKMRSCRQGFIAKIDTSGEPRILYYRFRLNTDSGEIMCGRRLDDLSTAGDARLLSALGSEDVPVEGFQLTVFDPGFEVPAWYAGSVMYQIFPDRFAIGSSGIHYDGVESHERRGWPISVHESWDDEPDWREPYDPVDFFGGTFEGIEQKLDYLASLGVKVVYLNPVCEARSNHRYNTGDYSEVDPILGSWDEFERLCAAARERGMGVMLDTVLSHTGSSSKYFNLDDSYDSVGASQSEDSPYRSWYSFAPPGTVPPYRCWWNDVTLPEVDEHDFTWQNYILGNRYANQQGIIEKWIGHGVRGLRLDVADELPDDVLELIRQSARNCDPETAIIGEVWEDPTTKESYGYKRKYALGRSLDSVMNYPLRSQLINFALGHANALQLLTFLKNQRSNYPTPLYAGLMNLLSSHDVERIRSVLALGQEFRGCSREDQYAMVTGIDHEADAKGARLQQMLATIVYSLPGVPCLYYGDECGMQGGRDPFDRGTFPWNGKRDDCGQNLVDFYSELGKLREGSDALSSGQVSFYSYGRDVICILRVGLDGSYLCVANRSESMTGFCADLTDTVSGLSKTAATALRYYATKPECVFSTDEAFAADCVDGMFSGTIGPMTACIFHMSWTPDATMDEEKLTLIRPIPESMSHEFDYIEAEDENLDYEPETLAKPLDPGIGVICHITSVPNDDGPGTLGEPAKRFVDEIAAAGMNYWQILPLNPADENGSPYAGLSAFAGNTYLLDANSVRHIDNDELQAFIYKNRDWLVSYATFVAIQDLMEDTPWQEWPEEFRNWKPGLEHHPELAYGVWAEYRNQFEFQRQWDELHEYANSRGVKIIGDMPIYVSADSSDVWAHKRYFKLDEEGYVASEGGVPPDRFAAEGQRWGNPTYNWGALAADGYDWWLRRFERMFDLYDYVRLDHFIGFVTYYDIPADKPASEGEWLPGPGMQLFEAAHRRFGKLPVIAEDLGVYIPEVIQMMHDTGFPGMDVIQFSDVDARTQWQPKKNKLVFTGTHDTQTLIGWIKEHYWVGDEEALEISEELFERALNSGADVIIFPLQDILKLDDSSRMNVPGTVGTNWQWQATQDQIDEYLNNPSDE